MKKFQLSSHLPLVLLALLAFITLSSTSAVAQIPIHQYSYVTKWDTQKGDRNNLKIVINRKNKDVTVQIYWEKIGVAGTVDGWIFDHKGDITITFPSHGEYRVEIIEARTRSEPEKGIDLYFDYDNQSAKKLTGVIKWGPTKWTSTHKMFNGCTNLKEFPPTNTKPDLSRVLDMSYMFQNASKFDSDISNWDVSNVTNMKGMFNNAKKFKSPLNKWGDKVRNVTNMGAMFAGATEFDQPLNDWNVSSVYNMSLMFTGATSFNQPLDKWNVSSVTNMRSMFNGATSFNQPLNGWGKNTKYVYRMDYMFKGATSFNQPLDKWNVSSVTNMAYMFDGATAFDQSLGSWNVSKVEGMYYMLYNCGMNTPNYDATLIGWSKQKLHTYISYFVGPHYCDSERERQKIINDYGWSIIDKGKRCANQNIHLKQKTHNNVTIKPSQVIPVNFGHIDQNDSKTITFTFFNNTDDDVRIDEIKFNNSKKNYVLSKNLNASSKIIKGNSESQPISITLNGKTAGLESDMLVVKATAVNTGGGGKTLEYRFPLTGKVGDIPASRYHTDVTSNQNITRYPIYKSAIDKPKRATYFGGWELKNHFKISTNNIAIDTVNNLMFWTEISSRPVRGRYINSSIVSGLMDGEKLILESIKIIHRVYCGVSFSYEDIVSMGLAVNPKSRHLYFSFSSGELFDERSVGILRFGYDDISPSDIKRDVLSSHLACDSAGNLYYVKGKDIYKANADLTNPKQFLSGREEITGMSIDPRGNRLYFVENGVLKHASLGNSSAKTTISRDFINVTSIVHSRKENRVYYTISNEKIGNKIGYIDLKTKNKVTILPNGIQMPSAGRLALFPSKKAPIRKLAVYEGTDNTGKPLNSTSTAQFGTNTILNTKSVTNQFVIYNEGDAPLEISKITLPANYSTTLSTPFTLPEKDKKAFPISLSRKNAGDFNGTVTIESNATSGDYTFKVAGKIAKTKIAVFEGKKQNGKIIVTNSTIDMGSTPLSENMTKTYGIKNPTDSDINNVEIKSDNPLFEVKNAPNTIPSLQSRNFDVVLIATKRGNHSGNITISSDIFTHTFVVKGEVTLDKAIEVYNVVTPNGDDVHDYLKIKNIQLYPNNKVTIFNRWGDVVYEMEKYDNDNERKRFDGTANKSGIDLITGNYYYAIDLGDGSKVITGFLFLKK